MNIHITINQEDYNDSLINHNTTEEKETHVPWLILFFFINKQFQHNWALFLFITAFTVKVTTKLSLQNEMKPSLLFELELKKLKGDKQ